jgi:hypothetical protein
MASSPPPPLRLLPAGATSCRVGFAPTGKRRLFTAHCYPASYDLRRRLRRPEIAHSGRPGLLVPARVLADRLFCGCGELEDPIGAAGDL